MTKYNTNVNVEITGLKFFGEKINKYNENKNKFLMIYDHGIGDSLSNYNPMHAGGFEAPNSLQLYAGAATSSLLYFSS